MSPQKKKTVRWLCPLAALFAAAACSTQERKPDPAASMETSVASISDQLVRVAELRTDLRSIKTCIHAFREDSSEAGDEKIQKASESQEDRIGHALEQEFMLALANEIYVIDSEALDAEGASSCAHTGASHVLVGSYVLRGEELELSVRLVDTDSRVIVAATRGLVPTPAFVEPAVEAQPERVAANPTQKEVVSTALPPAVVAVPETTSTPTATRTVFKAPQTVQPTGANEDSAALPLRKAYEISPEEIPPLTPEPRQVEPSTPTEDFETWRKRKLEGEGAIVPAKPAATPAELARETQAPKDSTFPWRNATLDELLGIPSAAPRVGPDPGSPQPVSSGYPWRTQKLAELLRVKK